jgi:4-hydroxybenzoate polyprenyltransferase
MLQASLFLVTLGLISLFILFQLPVLAIYVGLAAAPLVVLYPLAKRVTWFPQFVLGLTFSWGVFLGWVAVTGTLPDQSIMLIYAGSAAWVFGYDTIYAIQDMQDDRIAGVKSSALALSHHIKGGVASAYCLAIGLIAAGLLRFDHQPVAAAWFGLAGMAAHLGHQIWQLKSDDAVLALALFKSNRNAGLLVVAGLVLDRLIAS